MATKFGEQIRELRTNQSLLLVQVASQMDADTSIISKVERGVNYFKKEQIPLLAQNLKADKKEPWYFGLPTKFVFLSKMNQWQTKH